MTLTATWALNPDVNGGSVFVISEVFSNSAMGMMSEVQSFFLDATGDPTRYDFKMDMGGGVYQASGSRAR